MREAFRPGQRWISASEPELGLGEVRSVGARTVTLIFRASKETREYVQDNAPLRRAEFRVGDTIEVGAVAGKVIEVGLFASEIHTIDGLYQFVPNSELWNKKLTNFSRLPRRLVSVRVKLTDPTVIELHLLQQPVIAILRRDVLDDLVDQPLLVFVVEVATDRRLGDVPVGVHLLTERIGETETDGLLLLGRQRVVETTDGRLGRAGRTGCSPSAGKNSEARSDSHSSGPRCQREEVTAIHNITVGA